MHGLLGVVGGYDKSIDCSVEHVPGECNVGGWAWVSWG